jgi:hypothetical protein
MKIHYDNLTGVVTGYTLTGPAPAGSLDLGDGVDYDFIHDFDEYEVQNGAVVHVGPNAEKLADIEAQRQLGITSKATQIIEAKYSSLKQRKLMSIAIALQDKQIQGLTLTTEEEALLQTNRDVNTWITSVRDIENTAITDGTLLDDIVWPE